MTLVTALLILAALEPKFARQAPSASAVDVRQSSEHLAYVIPRAPAPTIASTRLAARSSARPTSPPEIAPPAQEGVTAPPPDTSSLAPPASAAPAKPNVNVTFDREAKERTTSIPRAPAGAPAASATVGFTRRREPIRFDSVLRAVTDSIGIGLATGVLKPPPPTQAERDAKWREEAFEVAAARGAGVPVRRTMARGGVSVPLPFGGPSRKQRERDRAIEAQLKVVRALRQQRVDSVVAARARRRADSVARLTDSLHPGTRP